MLHGERSMHELPQSQAAGLMGLSRPNGPQLVAMVHHGDEHTELPVLWRLCSAMTELGYSVTVLDATKSETDTHPGLQELMDYRFGYGSPPDAAPAADTPEWTIVSSAQGVQNMCQLQTRTHAKRIQSLHRMGQLFPGCSLIILYAGVDALVQMLGGTGCKPLLTVADNKTSLMTSYLALKRLLLKAHLTPTLLHMMAPPSQGRQLPAHSVASHLSKCAKSFLGFELNAIQIDPEHSEPAAATDMRRLAARMLENAVALRAQTSAFIGTDGTGAIGSANRSH